MMVRVSPRLAQQANADDESELQRLAVEGEDNEGFYIHRSAWGEQDKNGNQELTEKKGRTKSASTGDGAKMTEEH